MQHGIAGMYVCAGDAIYFAVLTAPPAQVVHKGTHELDAKWIWASHQRYAAAEC